jgi:hypothetical protein
VCSSDLSPLVASQLLGAKHTAGATPAMRIAFFPERVTFNGMPVIEELFVYDLNIGSKYVK